MQSFNPKEHDLNLGRRPSALAAYKKLPPKIEEKKQFKRKPGEFSEYKILNQVEGTPLDITTASGYELLSEKERELCSSLRLFPQQYLVIKDTLIRESIRQGVLKKATARQLIKIGIPCSLCSTYHLKTSIKLGVYLTSLRILGGLIEDLIHLEIHFLQSFIMVARQFQIC